MKNRLIFFSLTFAGLTPSFAPHAQAQSGLPQALLLERAVGEFYRAFPAPALSPEVEASYEPWLAIRSEPPQSAPQLNERDLRVAAETLAQALADLPTPLRNHVITHLLVDYRHSLEQRPAVRAVLLSLVPLLQPILEEQSLTQRWPFLKILDRVSQAFIFAEGFALGRGVWSGVQSAGLIARSGTTLTRLERFRVVVAEVAHSTRLRQPLMLAALGIGTTAGAVEAYLIPQLLNGFETLALDPSRLLPELDREILLQNARRTEALRAQVCDELSSPVAAAVQSHIQTELRSLMLEAADLQAHAPGLSHSLRARDHLQAQLKDCLLRLTPEEAPAETHRLPRPRPLN